MSDTWAQALPWLKALHIIAVISWMAGLLYLPRLFVYHSKAARGSDSSEMLKVMERRLLRTIINPAMIAALVFGGIMLALTETLEWSAWWLHIKLVLVVGMFAVHGYFSKWRKDFEADRNIRSQRFYRIANEIPTLLMIGIVILVVVRPF